MSAAGCSKALIMSLTNGLNHISQQPKWMADNIYLLRGHRPPTDSYIYCLKSIFRLHNETLNIWTHLIPCIIFLILLYRLIISEDYNAIDKIIVGAYNLAALACHALSATYHIFACHTKDVGRFFQKLDFIGIVGLITLSIVSWIHSIYGSLSPIYSITYITIFLFFAIVLIVVLTNNKFCKEPNTILRVIILTSFAISAIVPTIHWLINYWHLKYDYLNLSGILFMSQGIYFLGTLLYAFQVPERLQPGHNYAVLQLVKHFKTIKEQSIIMTPNIMIRSVK